MSREMKEVYYNAGWSKYEQATLPLITKEELLTIHPRYLKKNRPVHLREHGDDEYFGFYAPESFRLMDIPRRGGWFAVRAKDYKDAMKSLPHIPNKKESKALRKARIKQGR